MNSFRKLPFVLSAIMAVLVGITSFLTGVDNQTVYLRMIITMIVFFLIGRYAGNTLGSVKSELDEKNAELELERVKQEEMEKEKEAVLAAEMAQGRGLNINLAASDDDEDFQPLTVSRVISGKMSQ